MSEIISPPTCALDTDSRQTFPIFKNAFVKLALGRRPLTT
jgi:hypothetical protein